MLVADSILVWVPLSNKTLFMKGLTDGFIIA